MECSSGRAGRLAAIGLILALAGAGPATAAGYELLSAGVQARIGEQTLLGKDSPESFFAYDLRAAVSTPLERNFASGLSVGARWLMSAGLLEGPDKSALAVSAVPLLALGTQDRRFTFDGGIGLALLSAHRYAEQDFGGPLQFALTLGLEAPLFHQLGFAYRFMHYSDAGSYGPHTIGADLHMAGFTYRY